jgi:hypothetical protein
VGLVVPLAVTSAQAAPSAGARTASFSEHTRQSAGSPLTVNLIDEVGNAAAIDYPSSFSSVMATQDGTHIVVFLTKQDPNTQSAIAAMAAPGVISFATAPWTKSQILTTQSQVVADWNQLDAQGIKVISIFPSINGDALIHTGVENLTDSQADMLNQDFGAAHLSIANVSPANLPQPLSCVPVNRTTDCHPWTAGDTITNHTAVCSTGAGILLANGLGYTLTASHCFTNNNNLCNTYYGSGGTFMGTQRSSDTTDGGDDTAVLNVDPTFLVWAGVLGSLYIDQPFNIGAATNPDGYRVYDEGSISGEEASIVQNNFYGCLTLHYDNINRDRKECNLVESQSSNNGEAVQAGDSGGPVIRPVGGPGPGNGYDYITGIVSAGGGNHVTCQGNTWSTPCYNIMYYTAADEIQGTEYPGSTIG